jgi:hypothetical protein
VDTCREVVDGETYLDERMGYACYAVQFMVRRDIALHELFSLNIHFEDVDWTPRMLFRAKRVASVDSIVYNYLWREGSITLSQKDIAKQRKQLCDKIYLLQKLNEWGNKQKNRVVCRVDLPLSHILCKPVQEFISDSNKQLLEH